MTTDLRNIESHFYTNIGTEFSHGIQTLGQNKIGRWVIRRGMEFQSPWIWWGDVNKTRAESYGGGPHEGLDFALAEMAKSERSEAGMDGLRVPAFTDGKIIWKFPDLVGDTVIVATDQSFEDYRMIIQYSHIDFENADVGDPISQGHDIGKIKLSNNPKSITASHLHISVAIIKEFLLGLPDNSVDFNNWLKWDKSGELINFNPLSLVNPEVKANRFLLGEKANSPISCLISTGANKDERLELRRILSRTFPGIQSIGKKTIVEAESILTDTGLLVNIKDGQWEIKYGPRLTVSPSITTQGRGYPELIETISEIEDRNTKQRV